MTTEINKQNGNGKGKSLNLARQPSSGFTSNSLSALGRKLQSIREQLGKVVVCTIGVTDEPGFDILKIETAVPFEEELPKEVQQNMAATQQRKKQKSYIG